MVASPKNQNELFKTTECLLSGFAIYPANIYGKHCLLHTGHLPAEYLAKSGREVTRYMLF